MFFYYLLANQPWLVKIEKNVWPAPFPFRRRSGNLQYFHCIGFCCNNLLILHSIPYSGSYHQTLLENTSKFMNICRLCKMHETILSPLMLRIALRCLPLLLESWCKCILLSEEFGLFNPFSAWKGFSKLTFKTSDSSCLSFVSNPCTVLCTVH